MVRNDSTTDAARGRRRRLPSRSARQWVQKDVEPLLQVAAAHVDGVGADATRSVVLVCTDGDGVVGARQRHGTTEPYRLPPVSCLPPRQSPAEGGLQGISGSWLF